MSSLSSSIISFIAYKLNELENSYDNKFKEIYKAINYLINPPDKVRRQIGFKRKSE